MLSPLESNIDMPIFGSVKVSLSGGGEELLIHPNFWSFINIRSFINRVRSAIVEAAFVPVRIPTTCWFNFPYCCSRYVGNKELDLVYKPVEIWKVTDYRGCFCSFWSVTYSFRNCCSHISQYFVVPTISIQSDKVCPLVQMHMRSVPWYRSIYLLEETLIATADATPSSALVTFKINVMVLSL